MLYVLMIAAPALGAAAWYGKIASIGDMHEIVGKALVLLAVAHLVVAILHRVLWNDGTMERMFKPGAE